MEHHLITVSLYEKLSTTGSLVVGSEGMIVLWPPRSPDITPMDFFFWGYLKHIVYAKKYAYATII
jgi:hypothetical protein